MPPYRPATEPTQNFLRKLSLLATRAVSPENLPEKHYPEERSSRVQTDSPHLLPLRAFSFLLIFGAGAADSFWERRACHLHGKAARASCCSLRPGWKGYSLPRETPSGCLSFPFLPAQDGWKLKLPACMGIYSDDQNKILRCPQTPVGWRGREKEERN